MARAPNQEQTLVQMIRLYLNTHKCDAIQTQNSVHLLIHIFQTHCTLLSSSSPPGQEPEILTLTSPKLLTERSVSQTIQEILFCGCADHCHRAATLWGLNNNRTLKNNMGKTIRSDSLSVGLGEISEENNRVHKKANELGAGAGL